MSFKNPKSVTSDLDVVSSNQAGPPQQVLKNLSSENKTLEDVNLALIEQL